VEMIEVESTQNLERARSLIECYKLLELYNLGSPLHRGDLLRACVVFLHSTIEELVRNLFLSRLPHCDRSVLNEIPFSSHEANHRARGVLLGDLLENFQGKLVENVIIDSINAYVDVLNINNTDQLSAHFVKVDVEISPLRSLMSDLNTLMFRRHQIVHQMDRSDRLDPDREPVTEITLDLVEKWFQATEELVNRVVAQVT